jgi:phosphoribosyl-ATP pyrophosphohydrolase
VTHPLEKLWRTVEARRGADPASSYTAKLIAAGVPKAAQKLGEEAVETVVAAVAEDEKALVAESADLLYHLLVLWAARGIEPDLVWAELARREGRSGLAEKAARKEE